MLLQRPERQIQRDWMPFILAKEMSQLSMTERDYRLQEVHGVADKINEDPVFVQERLGTLKACVTNIPHKNAYDRAIYLSPEYVHDERFLLMFLRSENFDPLPAAERLWCDILKRSYVYSDLIFWFRILL
jgi:hypothetical protein